MDVEAIGLDGQCLLVLEVVCWVLHDNVEPLQDVDEDDLDFLPGEGATLEIRAVSASSRAFAV